MKRRIITKQRTTSLRNIDSSAVMEISLYTFKYESSNFLDPRPRKSVIAPRLRRLGIGLSPCSLGFFSKQHKRSERFIRRTTGKKITISMMEIPQSSLKLKVFMIREQLLVHRDWEVNSTMMHICYEHFVHRCWV